MTKDTKEKSKVQIAFEMYEHVFATLNNAHMNESNRFEEHPILLHSQWQ